MSPSNSISSLRYFLQDSKATYTGNLRLVDSRYFFILTFFPSKGGFAPFFYDCGRSPQIDDWFV
ncbi:hypothetical protein TSUD_09200 [Trifolium subterraneum]|nr:hypothetical protein TSUD_09200 [Trifolium subterraneum]